MSSLWEQRVSAVEKAIRQRDMAAGNVDAHERRLSEAEGDLAVAHGEFIAARDALFHDFPELDQGIDVNFRAPATAVIGGVTNHLT